MKCPDCLFLNDSDSKFCKECGTRLEESASGAVMPTKTMETSQQELSTGSTFAGRYQIIEELGQGGMGRVYKVLDTRINEKIALKLIKPEIASDKKTIERFSNELKYARKIAHRNVCKMYDLGEDKDSHFITMEYVSGGDLKSFSKRSGQLTIGKAIAITKQICEGLSEAHKLDLVHRDLKPNNIMIDKDGNVRIMDFGIARSLKTKSMTGQGVMIGTPEYMSPEQVEGKEVDQRSDIYSLGIILYEMVTGELPFSGDSAFSIGIKQKSESPPDPKQFNPRITEDLNRIILKCLAKDKEQRFQSGADICTELIRIEEGLPTTQKTSMGKKSLTSKEITVQLSVKKLLLPAVGLIILILTGFLLWNLLLKKEILPIDPAKPSLAVLYFENSTGDNNFDHWRRGLASLLIADLQQSKYLNILSSDRLFSIAKDLDLLEAAGYTSEDLKKVTARGRVSHILLGILTKAGTNFRINITLQQAVSGKIIGTETVEGTGEESFHTMVDALTKKVKAQFSISNEQLAKDIDREVEQITTASSEAFKLYVEGRKLHMNEEYMPSITLMKKALEIDPEFAMAYRSLAMTNNNLGLLQQRQEFLEKAMQLSDRLSDRERLIIQGDYYNTQESTFKKAIAAYQEVITLYPNDSIVNHNLGNLYVSLEDREKAIDHWQTAINYESEFVPTYTQLAELFSADNKYAEAEKTLRAYLEIFPDHASIHRNMGALAIYQRKIDLAFSELNKAVVLQPDYFENNAYKGMVYHFMGDLNKAEVEYFKLSSYPAPAARYYSANGLTDIYLGQGKYQAARTILRQSAAFAATLGIKWAESEFLSYLAYTNLQMENFPEALEAAQNAWQAGDLAQGNAYVFKRHALFYTALSYLGMGQIDHAQQTAEELKEMIQAGINPNKIRLYYFLKGLIDLEKDDRQAAQKSLEAAVSNRDLHNYVPQMYLVMNQHIWHCYSLGQVYFHNQDFEKAAKLLENTLAIGINRMGYSDIRTRCNYLLGQIYQELGQKEKAVQNYNKFIELLQDADPGQVEIADARLRLKQLQQN